MRGSPDGVEGEGIGIGKEGVGGGCLDGGGLYWVWPAGGVDKDYGFSVVSEYCWSRFVGCVDRCGDGGHGRGGSSCFFVNGNNCDFAGFDDILLGILAVDELLATAVGSHVVLACCCCCLFPLMASTRIVRFPFAGSLTWLSASLACCGDRGDRNNKIFSVGRTVHLIVEITVLVCLSGKSKGHLSRNDLFVKFCGIIKLLFTCITYFYLNCTGSLSLWNVDHCLGRVKSRVHGLRVSSHQLSSTAPQTQHKDIESVVRCRALFHSDRFVP